MSDNQNVPERPTSVTPDIVALTLFLAFLSSIGNILFARPFANTVYSALFILIALAVTVFTVEILINQVHRKASTGLDWSRWQPNISRVLYKYLGLLASIGLIGILYWIWPEYRGSFYDRYYEFLRLTVPAWLLLAIPYIYLVDGRMTQPHDAWWQLGRLVTFQSKGVDRKVILGHLRGWLVKGFFLPLMFVYLCMDIDKLQSTNWADMTNFQHIYDLAFFGIFFLDVTVGCMGYITSFRLFDTHIRTVEPTSLGWLVALVCYQPFWSLINGHYIDYHSGHPWGVVLLNMPVVYVSWGIAILILSGMYVWATVYFGARFSNLTHRGIITNGPYRYTKHPAYIAKNLSYWFIAMPFIVHDWNFTQAIRDCLMLLMLNGIYYLRAKTEERHLSADPDYVAYAQWMAHNGLFRRRFSTNKDSL